MEYQDFRELFFKTFCKAEINPTHRASTALKKNTEIFKRVIPDPCKESQDILDIVLALVIDEFDNFPFYIGKKPLITKCSTAYYHQIDIPSVGIRNQSHAVLEELSNMQPPLMPMGK